MEERWPEGLGAAAETTSERRHRQAHLPGLTRLTWRERSFVQHYCGDAFGVGETAYRLAGYTGSAAAMRSSASRLLTKDNIKEAIQREFEAERARAHEQSDHALRIIDTLSRINAKDFFDTRGRRVPIEQLPREVTIGIKSIKPGRHGLELTFRDPLAACALRLRANGVLRETVRVEAGRSLETILADSWDPLKKGTLDVEARPGLAAAPPPEHE